MNTTNYNKIKKGVDDFYNHYKYLLKEINKLDIDNSYFKSFISNSLIIKICELNKDDYKSYLTIIKKDKVFDNLLDDTLTRKIKKILLRISPRFFIRRR